MRTLVVCVLVVSLCVPTPLWAASNPLTTAPPAACSPSTRAVAAPDVERVEVLKGSEARAFVTTLRQQNSVFRQAQKRSAEQLSARGFKPTENVLVVKLKLKNTTRPAGILAATRPAGILAATRPAGILAAIRDWFFPAVLAQTYNADDGSGYMVVQSWDDGNNATWEGNLFTQEDGGASTSLDSQIDVDPNYSLLWSEGSGDPGDGSGSREISGHPGNSSGSRFISAQSCNGGCRCMSRAGDCMLRAALDNSWNWCAAYAGGCAFFGAGWWSCMGLSCVSRIGALTISEMRLWRENCQNGCA
jgi:hypothetical protein